MTIKWHKMFPIGKLVVGNKGYRGEPDIISTPNSHDPVEVREFKVGQEPAMKLSMAVSKKFVVYLNAFAITATKIIKLYLRQCVSSPASVSWRLTAPCL
jgi:hypothetical protein